MAEQRPDRPTPKRPRPGLPSGGIRFQRGLFGWILFVALAIMLFSYVNGKGHEYTSIPFSEFLTNMRAGKVQSLTVEGDNLTGKFNEPIVISGLKGGPTKIQKFQTDAPANTLNQWQFVEWLDKNRGTATVEVVNTNNILMQVIVPLVPWILIFGFVWFFVFRQLRNSAGAGGMLGNFGKARAKVMSKEHTNITFDDVAGIEEAKEEVMEIVEFLKNPKKFQRLGGRIPRGVLLVGEPGTGKTLLAKAIAGEADVPFFSISGSDFVEMFVGVGASRVRDLFKQAKDNSPCIIFLDEIDAVGRRRGSGFSSGGHDEREQTLNAILVEMDGFDTNDQVIVCAATNRVDVLDPALTRPGRFDRQIAVPLPDVKGRLEILKVHSRKVKLGPNVDMLKLARATPGFSGADLAAIINESALGATLAGKEYIEQDDLEEARDKVRWGRARKSRVIDEKEKLATAYHEAGHAVIQWLEKDADPIHKVTIIPRGNYGGATMALPEKDRMSYSRKWCIATMKTMFAGRIAEEMFTGDINTGAMSDIRQASSIARRMVREWGMSDRLGFVFYGDDDSRPNMMGGFGDGREYSEETAKTIDEEVKKLIDRLYDETHKLLESNRERVEAMARALVRYETLDASDVDRIMRGDTLSKPTVGDLLERENRRGTVIAPGTDPTQPDVRPGLGGGLGGLPAPG
ncbi:MAG TPA: ATP-dependent zinc metalloprotease FtsH [Tepidisphaeraceae bacterium]|nr:ATP-dependent zinc metalloprotease FtsH [Tepidisphaeraceae bacterium]